MSRIIAIKPHKYLHRNLKTMAAPRVELPDVERLSPSVIRILGGNPGKVCLFIITFDGDIPGVAQYADNGVVHITR